MSKFEFFMAFYGLLLGLGVAELLTGFASFLRERQVPAIGLMTPLVGAVLLIEFATAFIDAWLKLQDIQIELGQLALPAMSAILYFLAAVVLVPRDWSAWPSLDDYFFKRRRWIIGFIFAAVVLQVALSVGRIETTLLGQEGRGLIIWAAGILVLFAGYALLFFSGTRRWGVTGAATVLTFDALVYILLPLRLFS